MVLGNNLFVIGGTSAQQFFGDIYMFDLGDDLAFNLNNLKENLCVLRI